MPAIPAIHSGIQNGDKIHNHDQVITPDNLSVIKIKSSIDKNILAFIKKFPSFAFVLQNCPAE
jgi:hypothetical protein